MKKVIFALTMITLILCILPFGTYAAENEAIPTVSPDAITTNTENSSQNSHFYTTFEDFFATYNENSSVFVGSGENIPDTLSVSVSETEDGNSNLTGKNIKNEDTTATFGTNTEENTHNSTTESQNSDNSAWSDTIRDTAEEYASELFCILTFIGSLITAFCYKKGLLPTLAEGINKIYSVVVNAGEKTNSLQAESAELLDAFVDRAMPILEKAKEVSTYAEKLHEESLSLKDEIEREKAERKVLSKILSGQIDMLYGVFMSANLPEYEKEQLGTQYNRLKGMICEGEANEGEN